MQMVTHGENRVDSLNIPYNLVPINSICITSYHTNNYCNCYKERH